ncbi:MAG: CBS domain containing-hemolysin-like protein [Phycisphaerales bacterium]|jgi:CBS domain containing-hemolysin-like protein
MELLIFYLVLAVGVSFLCSLCEAVVLSLPSSFATLSADQGHRWGRMLKRMKAHVDRPLGAILTLNTVANTFGAAGVGAQAAIEFVSVPIGLISGALTLTILIVSEIIPKTLGAVHAERFAAPVAYLVQGMIVLTYPVLLVLNSLARVIRGNTVHAGPSRDQIAIIAETARLGGNLDEGETEILQNLLRLRDTTVEEIMTPRTVVFSLRSTDTCDHALAQHPHLRFSRIPVLGDQSTDEILGVALKHEIHECVIDGRGERRLGFMTRKLQYVPETAPLTKVLGEFARLGQHLFGVVDEHGSFVGLISLEDVFESIIGSEIVDETDPIADMRDLAAASAPPQTPPPKHAPPKHDPPAETRQSNEDLP